MHCEKASSKFAVKAYMKKQPYLLVFLSLGASVFIFGLMIRIAERSYPDSPIDLIWNSWWLTLVTMTTIGYGDIVPMTTLGRLLAAISCIWGMFLISMFVVALTNKVEIAGEEVHIYNKIVERIFIRKKLKLVATKTI
jgi:voltage-gated potassium channel Kch